MLPYVWQYNENYTHTVHIGKKHALKKYDQFALNTSSFRGSNALETPGKKGLVRNVFENSEIPHLWLFPPMCALSELKNSFK